jgi:hypothetical protein
MVGFGEPSLGFAFGMQSVGFGLADGPNDTSKGDIENRDTQGFMHWKKMNLRASCSDVSYPMSFVITPRWLTMMTNKAVNQWKVLAMEP